MIPDQSLKQIGDQYSKLTLLRELEHVHKRINEVFTKGDITLDKDMAAEGATGNRTTTKIAGSVRFAAGATTVVVTHPRVTENSFIFAQVATNDTTAILKNAVPAAGSFTIRLSAAATAETQVNFILFV